jgi:phosphatidylethanolamine-binding protein (PEBP) family uncharacterized protein
VTFAAAQPGANYTLMMVDQDAFSAQNPVVSPVRHWLLSDIPGSVLASQGVNGDSFSVLSGYFAPAVRLIPKQ